MTPYPTVAPRRRCLWVVPVVLLVLAVSVLEGWAMVRLAQGPAPHADELAAEQVLDAPIAAVELGRYQARSRWGIGEITQQPALALAVYQVDVPADQALAAWAAAYGEQYGLQPPIPSPNGLLMIGITEERWVVVTAGSAPALAPDVTPSDIGLAPAAEGSTVLTVEIFPPTDLSALS